MPQPTKLDADKEVHCIADVGHITKLPEGWFAFVTEEPPHRGKRRVRIRITKTRPEGKVKHRRLTKDTKT